MKDQFIPYKYTKMMKELGFVLDSEEITQVLKDRSINKAYMGILFQRAEEWIWEKYNWRITTRKVDDKYTYEIFNQHNNPFEYGVKFDSPIMAKKNGITEAIEHLHSKTK